MAGGTRKRLEVYLDTIYERADEDFFAGTIVPALESSNRLIVINSPGARASRRDGKPNWVEREIEVFQNLPQGGNISVAVGAGEFDDPFPSGLATRFENMEIVDLRKLDRPIAVMAWADARLDAEVRKLIAKLHAIPPERMPLLHREEERRRWRTVLTLSAMAAIVIAILSVALFSAVRSRSTAMQALAQSRISLADSLALLSRRARENGDSLGAVAYVSEARRQAVTPLAIAETIATERPLLTFGRTLNDDRARIFPVAFLGDAHRVVTGSFDGSLHLFDADSGAILAATKPTGIPVTAVATSADGRLIVSASRKPADINWENASVSGRLDLWTGDGAGFHFLRSIANASCLALAVDRNGTTAIGATDAGVVVWQLGMAGTPSRVIDSFERMTSVAISPSGRYATAGSILGPIRIYDLATNRTVREIELSPPLRVYEMNLMGVAFAPDEQTIASGSYDGTVRIWGVLDTSSDAALEGHTAAVQTVAFSRDGAWLLSGSWDRTSRLWDVGTKRTRAVVRADRAIVNSVAWSGDGRVVATVESVPASRSGSPEGQWRFGTLRTWNAQPTSRVAVAIPEPSDVIRLAFDDHARLSVWSATPRLRVDGERGSRKFGLQAWPFVPASEMIRRQQPVQFLGAGVGESSQAAEVVTPVRGERVLAIDASPRGDAVAICIGTPHDAGDRFRSARVLVLDAATGTMRKQLTIPGDLGAVGPIRFAPDGVTMAIAFRHGLTGQDPGGGELIVWNSLAETRKQFSGEGNAYAALDFTADGSLLAAGKSDGAIDIWNVGTGKSETLTFDLFGPSPLIAVDRHGQELVATTLAQFCVWNLAAKTRKSFAVPPTFNPTAIAISPDGSVLAVATSAGEIELWDLERGEQLDVIRPHDGIIAELMFSPDGSRLASLGRSGVRIWGGVVPAGNDEVMRMTRLIVRNGAVVPIDAMANRPISH